MLFSVLTRKGKVPRLSEVHALAKRRGFQHQPVTLPWTIGPTPSLGPPTSAQTLLKRQISALSARRPDPAQPSSLREPGAQDSASPQAAQMRTRSQGL